MTNDQRTRETRAAATSQAGASQGNPPPAAAQGNSGIGWKWGAILAAAGLALVAWVWLAHSTASTRGEQAETDKKEQTEAGTKTAAASGSGGESQDAKPSTTESTEPSVESIYESIVRENTASAQAGTAK